MSDKCKTSPDCKMTLGPWFEAHGMTRLDQVADYISSLQQRISKLLMENERFLRDKKADVSSEASETTTARAAGTALAPGEPSPCPFCGSSSSLDVREYRYRRFSEYKVVCTPGLCGCGGEGPSASERPQAVDHWNERKNLKDIE